MLYPILTVQFVSVNIESMNSELTIDERAARHAALAEPVRLEMVDLLTLGDWSPSELQSRLGLPSNLLAHHLNVLENAGIVGRGRSEADRRRSYVRLEGAALNELGIGQTVAAKRVVFVCTANSARSQLAVALWTRASTVPAASGGTHPADRIHPIALETAREHGLTVRGRRPRLLDEVRRPGDVIVTVCDNAHESCPRLPGRTRVVHVGFDDPPRLEKGAASDEEALDHYRRVRDEIRRFVEGLPENLERAAT